MGATDLCVSSVKRSPHMNTSECCRFFFVHVRTSVSHEAARPPHGYRNSIIFPPVADSLRGLLPRGAEHSQQVSSNNNVSALSHLFVRVWLLSRLSQASQTVSCRQRQVTWSKCVTARHLSDTLDSAADTKSKPMGAPFHPSIHPSRISAKYQKNTKSNLFNIL